jgi:hypothetical protein
LTQCEAEQCERLLGFQQNEGKGWKANIPPSTALPSLTKLERQLDAALTAATTVQVIAQLARLANHYRGERPESSWDMLFEDYARDLDGISLAHLSAILDSARREKSWYPKVADLVRLWTVEKFRDAEKRRRTRILLGKEDAKSWETV